MSLKSLIILSSAIVLGGCATTQLTSGSAYLEKYSAGGMFPDTQIDQDIRNIAAVEPQLAFPARIGLARIEQGRVTTIPGDEAEHWSGLAESLGADYGEFVPVSPLIASMVSPPQIEGQLSANHVVDHIRRGSARQHLDYVLVYEVNNKDSKKSNALRVTDLTVLGLFIMPSRKIEIDSTASAILMDVRNGYPYGTASAFAEKSSVGTAAGSQSRKDGLNHEARIQAVESLTVDVADMFKSLRSQIVTKSVSR